MRSYRELFPDYADRFQSQSHFLHLVLPSVVRPGEPFALRAVMMDASGMPDEGYTGRIPLKTGDPALRVPETLEFTPEDMGRTTVEGLAAEEEGAYHVVAEPADCPGHPPVSNPCRVRAGGRRLYWGDIHMHTVVGNCHPDTCKSPDFGYWYAREAALTDFGSATDHLRGIHRLDGNWEELKRSARQNHQPGRFVTLLAFESSHATGYGGDNNIYYGVDEADFFWKDREDMTGIAPKVGLDELWAWLDEQGAPYVSIPHHTGRAGKYRDFENRWHNPERETVLEVFSWWGSSEGRLDDIYLKDGKSDRRSYWRDALELGHRYGAICSSDTHTTTPATPLTTTPENYHYPQLRLNAQGVAAIYADELTREGIFESLLNRRCYGTTWWRPVIEFDVSGVKMGRVGEADARVRERRAVRASVATSRPRTQVTLYRNNEPIHHQRIEPGLTQMEFVDEEPLEEVVLRDAPKSERPFAFYYLKAFWNSHIAWSSPVWLTL
ncbi:MAG: hypothetical protein ACOC7T_03450 [Planctomycetota bacterium]